MTTIDEFVFAPPRPGMWDSRSPTDHEAAHAVTALFFGVTVVECRVDGDLDGGVTRVLRSEVQERLWEALIVRMAGPFWSATPIAWPPARGCGGDEDVCALLVDRLGMDETGWRESESFLKDLFRIGSPWRRAAHAVADALRERGALRGDEVARIVDECTTMEGSAGHGF